MAKRFTRNIDNVEDITKLPLYLTLQNDLVSDDKDVYVKNGDKYEKITGNGGGGNVASLYFDKVSNGISVLSTVNGNVSSDQVNGYYYSLQIVFDNGQRDGMFFSYDAEKDLSTARKNMTPTQIKGRTIVGAQIEKVTPGDPYKYEVVAFEPFAQTDYKEPNVYSPYYLKNKPIDVISWSWTPASFQFITRGDTTAQAIGYVFSFNEEWGTDKYEGNYIADVGVTIYTLANKPNLSFKNVAIALTSEDLEDTYIQIPLNRGDLSEENDRSPYFVDGKETYVLKSDYDELVARVTALENK